MVRDTNGEMKTLGQSCYEVSYQVRQYEWCCRLPGTGFPVCQASDTDNDNQDDEFQVSCKFYTIGWALLFETWDTKIWKQRKK